MAKLVLPTTDRVMEQQGSALEIFLDIDAVAKSSRSWCGEPSVTLTWRSTPALVEEAIQSLQGKDVSQESLKQCRSGFLTNCRTLGIVASDTPQTQ